MTTNPITLPIPADRPAAADFELSSGVAPWKTLLRSGLDRPLYLAAATLLIILVTMAVAAPVLPFADPDHQSILDRLSKPLATDNTGAFHIAGTDQLGRDILSRVVYGARISLLIAFAVVAISSVAGIALGLVAGYKGGLVDNAVMRVVDFQQAFPPILWAIFILYLIGSSLTNLVILLAILNWVSYARIVRAQTLSLRNQPFVEGAISIGCSDRRILFRHILPQLSSVLGTFAVLDFVSVILAEAGLSFLGLGVQPPTSSLGRMVADGQEFLYTGGWWLFVIPGIAIFLIVLSANLTSKWMQEIADHAPSRKGFKKG
jgi:peptide/nickel transport system permease protein